MVGLKLGGERVEIGGGGEGRTCWFCFVRFHGCLLAIGLIEFD
jgi:hypothetical protein